MASLKKQFFCSTCGTAVSVDWGSLTPVHKYSCLRCQELDPATEWLPTINVPLLYILYMDLRVRGKLPVVTNKRLSGYGYAI